MLLTQNIRPNYNVTKINESPKNGIIDLRFLCVTG